MRPHVPLSLLVAITVGVLVVSLGHSATGVGASLRRTGAVAGAPQPQPGRFVHYRFACRLAARNRYLPRRAGCVSVLRADVDGDGRDDLVILYAELGHRRDGRDYLPVRWTLEVARASGTVARTRVSRAGDHPFLTRVGNVNGVRGDELLLQTTQVSSGSPEALFTFHAAHLRHVITLSAGGDSAARERFSCRLDPTPRIVAQTMELLGSTIRGRWRWTTTTYLWRGASLHRQSSHRAVKRGLPAIGRRALGGGCGRLVGPAGVQ